MNHLYSWHKPCYDIIALINLSGSIFKVLWRSYSGYQTEAAIFCQWFLWCTTYPVSVGHSVHLSGDSNQCNHIWRPTWRCYRQHAGKHLLFLINFINKCCLSQLWYFGAISMGKLHCVVCSCAATRSTAEKVIWYKGKQAKILLKREEYFRT